jgi:hypothetical protein
MEKDIPVSSELDNFLNKYANDVFSMKLFLFFKDHPYAQLSEQVIMSATGKDLDRCLIKKALEDFAERGIIKKSISHGVLFYSLAEKMHSLAVEMDKIEQKKRCSRIVNSGSPIEPLLNNVIPTAMFSHGYQVAT